MCYRHGPPYHGLSGLQIGFLVAFTQLIPEHQLQFLGALRIKVKVRLWPLHPLHPDPSIFTLSAMTSFNSPFELIIQALPGIYLLLSNVAVILLGPSPYILIQFGFFVSWVYLRFFKLSEDGLRGDRSETFAFQYWFPQPIR